MHFSEKGYFYRCGKRREEEPTPLFSPATIFFSSVCESGWRKNRENRKEDKFWPFVTFPLNCAKGTSVVSPQTRLIKPPFFSCSKSQRPQSKKSGQTDSQSHLTPTQPNVSENPRNHPPQAEIDSVRAAKMVRHFGGKKEHSSNNPRIPKHALKLIARTFFLLALTPKIDPCGKPWGGGRE